MKNSWRRCYATETTTWERAHVCIRARMNRRRANRRFELLREFSSCRNSLRDCVYLYACNNRKFPLYSREREREREPRDLHNGVARSPYVVSVDTIRACEVQVPKQCHVHLFIDLSVSCREIFFRSRSCFCSLLVRESNLNVFRKLSTTFLKLC